MGGGGGGGKLRRRSIKEIDRIAAFINSQSFVTTEEYDPSVSPSPSPARRCGLTAVEMVILHVRL